MHTVPVNQGNTRAGHSLPSSELEDPENPERDCRAQFKSIRHNKHLPSDTTSGDRQEQPASGCREGPSSSLPAQHQGGFRWTVRSVAAGSEQRAAQSTISRTGAPELRPTPSTGRVFQASQQPVALARLSRLAALRGGPSRRATRGLRQHALLTMALKFRLVG